MADNRRVDFKDLRQRADFRAILAHYGLKPVGNGDQLKIRCPFHRRSRAQLLGEPDQAGLPLLRLRDRGQRARLRAPARNRGGQGTVTIRQAALKLAEISGIELPARQALAEALGSPRTGLPLPKQRKARPPPPRRLLAPQRAEGLRQGSRAEAVNKPLGFALTLDPAHPYLERARHLAGARRALRPRVSARRASWPGRVCIPIHNADGQIVAYAGRWVRAARTFPKGRASTSCRPGFRKELELFNLHRVKHCRHLVVVEGYFGAIRLHGLRIPAVALMGTSVSIQQLELLAHANARHITVLLDGDEAGREAAEKVAGAIANVAWCRIVHLPDGRQPDTVDRAELERLLGRTEK